MKFIKILILLCITGYAYSQNNDFSLLITPINKPFSINQDNSILIRDSSIDSLFSQISNENVLFVINSKYNVTVAFWNKTDTFAISNISRKLAKYFYKYLSSPQRDWVGNLLLYSLFEKYSFPLYKYQSNNYKDWQKNGKIEDVKYWKSVVFKK